MRYIGNKTRLVPFLLRSIRELELKPGVACDPFAGTASVGAALKADGWQVHAGDLMELSYAFQVARVALDDSPRGVDEALDELSRIPGEHGFITEHFTPGGRAGRKHGRMYFSVANALRIDAMRDRIDAWETEGSVDAETARYLVACLIQAADRVANTTGVYASFVKSWQPNAKRSLELLALPPTPSGRGRAASTAFRGPAAALARRVGCVDLLYLDPPYNQRQYPAYYHVPELLASGWDPPPDLRGKTGLIPDKRLRSDWCRPGACERALVDLLQAADARHVLLSYNDEGLLPIETIEEAFRSSGLSDSYRCFRHDYRRYRSDADGPDRRYRRNGVAERLHYVRR